MIMGGVINFGVIYSSARIALAERGRRLARSAGTRFTQGEVSYVLLGEQAVLCCCQSRSALSPVMVCRGFWRPTCNLICIACPCTCRLAVVRRAGHHRVGAAFHTRFVRRRIAGLDMIAVLKTQE